MTTKAYVMVTVVGRLGQYDCQKLVRKLEAIPEVKCAKVVSGRCDLLVELEAPLRVVLSANKIMAQDWVKRLDVLKVESVEFDRGEAAPASAVEANSTALAEAYFMVKVEESSRRHGWQDVVADLQAIPEVKSIETVSGACDLLLKVEAPIRVILVQEKLRAKEWVEGLHALRVEPVAAVAKG